ncbi:MAG: MarR family transcriptional regulator [Acidimicrobiales bacterium]|nr:MarR family transcriptional regulator [Acidimicrobiales bacterium]
MARQQQPSDADYRRLLELRTGLRRFLKWSGDRAEAAGLTPAQHQLLLAVRGHPEPHAPTIGQLADHLLLRHHSTVQLVDRAESAGWVVRVRDDADHRVARVTLTADGERVLASLAAEHLEELRRIGRSFAGL